MSEHTLDRMVAGLMKTAAQKLADEPMEKEASYLPPAEIYQRSSNDEAEKTASALEYLADCIEGGQLIEDSTSLERVKQAYDIVGEVESDPRLKFKIVTAMQEIPRHTGEAPSISPGMGGSAMRHDLQRRPGGGGTQQRATAGASGYAIPRSTNNPASSEHTAPGLMSNDLNDVPGGGGAYPERGPIRDSSVKSAFAMGRALRKQATGAYVAKDIAGNIKSMRATADEGRSAQKKGLGIGAHMVAARRHQHRLRKQAEFSPSSRGEGAKARITGKRNAAPLGNPSGASQAGENVPKQPSPSVIGSNRAAINYNKRDAKTKFVKREVGKVLSAPILDRGSDDVLQKNLSHTEVSKLASLARKELVDRALRGSVQPGSVKEAAWGGAGTAMAMNPTGGTAGDWARGTFYGGGGALAGGMGGTLGGGGLGAGAGALIGGGLGALAGRAGEGARIGGAIGGLAGATYGGLGGSFLGGRAGIEAATMRDAQARGLTPEQHREAVHTGMLGGAGGHLASGLVPGAGMVAAPALSHHMVKNRLQQMQGQPKQASLDRGGYQTEDKSLDDRRLERESAFRESLQDAARANGERMQGSSSMTGMPNSGSSITPSIPGY